MSLKRTPGGADQAGNGEKRFRLLSSDETTMSQMPVELIHIILIKAVAMEVKTMKLAKSVWKDKADLVISRLGSVCSHWSSILTTDFFRMELHRALDGQADCHLRLQNLRTCPIPVGGLSTASVGADTFVLRNDPQFGYLVDVLYTDNTDATLKRDVIYLAGKHPEKLVGCTLSGAAYLLVKDNTGRYVIRIERCGPHQFQFSTNWLTGIREYVSGMYISPKGYLLMVLNDTKQGLTLNTYDQSGMLLNQIMFERTQTRIKRISSICRKSNGNFVLVAGGDEKEDRLREIDPAGKTVRLYGSRLPRDSKASFADADERIVLDVDGDTDLILLDSEFNRLSFSGAELPVGRCTQLHGISMSSDATELASVVMRIGSCISFTLISYRFTEGV